MRRISLSPPRWIAFGAILGAVAALGEPIEVVAVSATLGAFLALCARAWLARRP